jgi:hypothetical protein
VNAKLFRALEQPLFSMKSVSGAPCRITVTQDRVRARLFWGQPACTGVDHAFALKHQEELLLEAIGSNGGNGTISIHPARNGKSLLRPFQQIAAAFKRIRVTPETLFAQFFAVDPFDGASCAVDVPVLGLFGVFDALGACLVACARFLHSNRILL